MTRFKDEFKVKNGLKQMFGINKPSPRISCCHDGSMFPRPPSREFIIILVLLLFSSLLWFCFSINIDIVQGKMKISPGKNSRII